MSDLIVRAQQIADYVDTYELIDEMSVDDAARALVRVRELLATTEQQRRDAKAPFDDAVKLLQYARDTLRGKIGAYQLAAVEAERADVAAALDAQASGDVDATVDAVNAIERAPRVAGVSVKGKWTASVVDADAVPREYCTACSKRLGAHARQYTDGAIAPSPIAGVTFTWTPQLTVRKK